MTFFNIGNGKYPEAVHVLRDVNMYQKHVVFRIDTNPENREIGIKVSMADYSCKNAEGHEIYHATWKEKNRMFEITFGQGCDKSLQKNLCRWVLEQQLQWAETWNFSVQ